MVFSSSLITEGASKSLISMAIFWSSLSALKNFSAPRSALSNVFLVLKLRDHR